MKVHIFLKKPLFGEYNKLKLYAFTDDKKLASEFTMLRDMNRFVYIKESMTKEEFKKYDNENHDYRLYVKSFRTKFEGSCNLVHPVKVICTGVEETSTLIRGENVILQELSKYVFDTQCINPKYLKSLERLLFIRMYGFFNRDDSKYDYEYYEPYFSPYMLNDIILEDLKTGYSLDELSMFLLLHRDTFSNK